MIHIIETQDWAVALKALTGISRVEEAYSQDEYCIEIKICDESTEETFTTKEEAEVRREQLIKTWTDYLIANK